jgi:hypothetical protein
MTMADGIQTSNLYGTVTDEKAQALPGVTITLAGQRAPEVQVTDAQGIFRFLDLQPGSYQAKAELEGFETSVYFPEIHMGRNTNIYITLRTAIE